MPHPRAPVHGGFEPRWWPRGPDAPPPPCRFVFISSPCSFSLFRQHLSGSSLSGSISLSRSSPPSSIRGSRWLAQVLHAGSPRPPRRAPPPSSLHLPLRRGRRGRRCSNGLELGDRPLLPPRRDPPAPLHFLPPPCALELGRGLAPSCGLATRRVEQRGCGGSSACSGAGPCRGRVGDVSKTCQKPKIFILNV